MNKQPNPLAPITFVDERSASVQSNKEAGKLVFTPVQESLFEGLEQLQGEVIALFDGYETPVMALNELLHFYLTHLEGSERPDTKLLSSVHDLVLHFETVRVLTQEIEYLQGESDKAETYLNQKANAKE